LDILQLSNNLFVEKGGKIYIGGNEVPTTMRGLLRDEAEYIQNSRLWEIINATLINEASDIALRQSTNWEHVLSAKQLHHYVFVVKNILYKLAQK